MHRLAWNGSDGERPSLSNKLAELDRELRRGPDAGNSVAMPPAGSSAPAMAPTVAAGVAECGPDHCVPCEALAALERAEADPRADAVDFGKLSIDPPGGGFTRGAPARLGRHGGTSYSPARRATSYLALLAAAGLGYYALNLPAMEAWSQSLDTFTTSWVIDRRHGDSELRPAVLRWSVGDDKGQAGPARGAARFAPAACASFAIEAGLRGSRAKTLGAGPAILIDVLADVDQRLEVRLPVRLVGLDGRGAISTLLIKNLPVGATLSSGRKLDSGRWALDPADLDQLTVRLADGQTADHDLELELIGHDGTVLASNAMRLGIGGGSPRGASADASPPRPAPRLAAGEESPAAARAPMPWLRTTVEHPAPRPPAAADQPGKPAVRHADRTAGPLFGPRADEDDVGKSTPWQAAARAQPLTGSIVGQEPKTPSAVAAVAANSASPATPATPAAGAKAEGLKAKDTETEQPAPPRAAPAKPATASRPEPAPPVARPAVTRDVGRVEPTAATLPRKPPKPADEDAESPRKPAKAVARESESPRNVSAPRPTVDAIQGPRAAPAKPGNGGLLKPMPGWAPFEQFNQQ